MWFGIVSLFPEMFQAVTDYGVTGRAVREGKVQLDFCNPRDFTHDKHRTVDDRPYGGGPGMLMKVQPLQDAIQAAKQGAVEQGSKSPKVIYLSPQGQKLDQKGVEYLSKHSHLILVSGRYEGVDQRLIDAEIDEEWSIGDFVLSGGEMASMVLIDAVTRQLPGVLGHEQSAEQDSFKDGLLDCPHYTRPEKLNGEKVPDVLLSGNHEMIRKWRLKQSLGQTWLKRQDLLQELELSEEQQNLLDEFIKDLS